MRAHSLAESNAFEDGSQLWIIKNDPNLIWWKKLDLHSHYLLSQNLLRQKQTQAPQLQNIISETNLKLPEYTYTNNHILIGTENHFLNKWILVWNDLSQSEVLDLIEKTTARMKASSVRFFSDSNLITQFEARPMASSISMSYVENT